MTITIQKIKYKGEIVLITICVGCEELVLMTDIPNDGKYNGSEKVRILIIKELNMGRVDLTNEVIEYIHEFDSSIIREDEHPKFKIGDCISNDKVEYTVLGYNRDNGGLCYVFKKNNNKFVWLTEQVDDEFHLVKRLYTPEKAVRIKALELYPPQKVYDRSICDYVDLNYAERKCFIEGGLFMLEHLMKDAIDETVAATLTGVHVDIGSEHLTGYKWTDKVKVILIKQDKE